MRRVLSIWKGEMLVATGPTWKETARFVAERHGLTLEDLRGPSRRKAIAHVRQEAFSLVRDTHELSLPRIGQLFGGRDHTTVLKGIRAHAKRMAA